MKKNIIELGFVALCFATMAHASALTCVATHFVAGITNPDCFLPNVQGNLPVVNGFPLIANGGEVDLFYAGYSSEATDTVFLNGIPLFTNNITPLGTEIDLGNFVAGQVLTFDLLVSYGGGTNFYHSGPGGLNSDGYVRDATAIWMPNSAIPEGGYWVGFEDGNALGDHDYQDLMFAITGITPGGIPISPTPPAVPEPASVFLVGGAVAFLYSRAARARQFHRA